MKKWIKGGMIGLFFIAMLMFAIATTVITDQGVTTPAVTVTDINVTGTLTVNNTPITGEGGASLEADSSATASGPWSTTSTSTTNGGATVKTFIWTAPENAIVTEIEYQAEFRNVNGFNYYVGIGTDKTSPGGTNTGTSSGTGYSVRTANWKLRANHIIVYAGETMDIYVRTNTNNGGYATDVQNAKVNFVRYLPMGDNPSPVEQNIV